jgi:tetratricopeptide (TPR) repeat protein
VLEDSISEIRTLSALADVYFTAGNYGTAADFQRQAVTRQPTDVKALIGLGYALWYGGSPANAEATFAQALDSDARSAAAFGGRGQVRAEMREYADALADLDIALALGLKPTDEIDARSARALALAGLGRSEEADRELAASRAQDPDRGRTLRRAARIAAMRDEHALAIAEADRALQADPPMAPWDQTDTRRLIVTLHHDSP